ncbi:hypothetical protein F4Z99_15000 [Candidatus Poribacteria bacterium]|nr:hypothetical protein [Candidatus Poribacteria bacterium]
MSASGKLINTWRFIDIEDREHSSLLQQGDDIEDREHSSLLQQGDDIEDREHSSLLQQGDDIEGREHSSLLRKKGTISRSRAQFAPTAKIADTARSYGKSVTLA